MSNRSEYCIVNELDDIRQELDTYRDFAQESLNKLREKLKAIAKENPTLEEDLEESDDLIECIDDSLNDIEDSGDNLNHLIERADDFAREHLEEAKNEGRDEGSDEGYREGYEQGLEDREDCIEHYEEFVWDWFESEFGNGKIDTVEYHVKAEQLKNSLADSKYEN